MADVTIMGAGVFGLALGYVCARRGARVRVVDPGGVAAGASGGLVGALAPHVPENWNAKKAFQFDALRAAEGFWAGVAQQSGRDPGYARLGRIQPVTEEGLARARARAETAAQLWQGFARWRVIRASAAPGLRLVSPSGWVIADDLSARLHPRAATLALAGAVVALGGQIVAQGGPSRGPVIWATGHEGLGMLSRALGRNVGGGVKGQALALRYSCPGAPQVFADGLHLVPHADGSLAIGSTSEREYDAPDTVDAQCDALHARALAICPELAGAEVIARWAGVRPRARSRAPLMGPWPGRAGAFVFNGGFKIGFALAPLLARVMADLVLDGHDAIPAAFRPPKAT